jgi:hypothetical protein
MNQILTPPPLVTRNISNKEKGRTHEKTFNLEEPSPTITTCFKIEVAHTRCNATNTFYV